MLAGAVRHFVAVWNIGEGLVGKNNASWPFWSKQERKKRE